MKPLYTALLTLTLFACGGSGTDPVNPLALVQDPVTPTVIVVQAPEPVDTNTPTPTPTPTPAPTPVAGACIDYTPLNDGIGWDGVANCPLPIIPATPEPEPVVEPINSYLSEATNYYCTAFIEPDNAWIWNFSGNNVLRDSMNLVTGNWSWTGSDTISVAPIGNPSVDAVDQGTRLGLFNSTSNTQWGSCTVATAAQIQEINTPPEPIRPVVTLPNGTMQTAQGWDLSGIAGKSLSCSYISYSNINGLWVSGSNSGKYWTFNADGTGLYSVYRLNANGSFNWAVTSDGEIYIDYIFDVNVDGILPASQKDANFVRVPLGQYPIYLQVQPTATAVNSGQGCKVT